jgi:hypothetical protein
MESLLLCDKVVKGYNFIKLLLIISLKALCLYFCCFNDKKHNEKISI